MGGHFLFGIWTVSQMIGNILFLTAVLKLASGHSVSIPSIHKEIDGTNIEVNITVDIDLTGDGSGDNEFEPYAALATSTLPLSLYVS